MVSPSIFLPSIGCPWKKIAAVLLPVHASQAGVAASRIDQKGKAMQHISCHYKNFAIKAIKPQECAQPLGLIYRLIRSALNINMAGRASRGRVWKDRTI